MTKYVFVTGGVVSGLGKGSQRPHWAAAEGQGVEGSGPEAGPIHQCGPRHHESLSAR